MKSLLFSCALLIMCVGLRAQKGLEGLWEGSITVGGIYSSRELPIQIYLTIDGHRVQGRTYVRISDGETVQMNLTGYLYHDSSIQLAEVEYVGDEKNQYFPKFNRQYQLIWKPDLWDAALVGYWQEVTGETFHRYRQRGRLKLSKKKNKGV